MPDRYHGLRDAIAAGPTPGPWVQDGDGVSTADEIVAVAICCRSDAEAAYIAAADPDTIAALLKERDALRDALQWYVGMSTRMGNASIAQDSQAVLTLMKEFAVNYGGRGRAALADGEAQS